MGTMCGEMDVVRLEGRRRLKQRISKVLRASLLSSSCSITSCELSHAVHEPVFVPGVTRGELVVGRQKCTLPWNGSRCLSVVAPLPSQHHCLRMQHLREMGDGGGEHARLPRQLRPATTATTRFRRNCSDKLPPASGGSSPYYEKTRGEEKRITIRSKDMQGGKGTRSKMLSNSYGFTSSSEEDSDINDGAVEVLFASDETETMFSSRSFSSDSSDQFYYSSSCRCSKRKMNRRSLRPVLKRQQKQREEEKPQDAAVNTFRPLVLHSPSSSCSSLSGGGSTGRARGDAASDAMEEEEEMDPTETAVFAVEKQSSDPKEDFRNSMLEMIMEKQVFGHRDLGNLLARYLSLNRPRHHPVIIQVFSEIRETLFGY